MKHKNLLSIKDFETLHKAKKITNRTGTGIDVLNEEKNEMGDIVTNHLFPPIPLRKYDWEAVRKDYDEGDLIGRGETEQDAINDLLEQEDELTYEAKKVTNRTQTGIDVLNEKFDNLNIGDVVKFVKKNDKNDITNAKITDIVVYEGGKKVKFKNLDFPNLGLHSHTEWTLSKYYDIIK